VLHRWSRAIARFDDQNLVSYAGLVPVMALAERAGLSDLVADAVKIVDLPIASTGLIRPGRSLRLWRAWWRARTALMTWT
jgi:hypothetical protein